MMRLPGIEGEPDGHHDEAPDDEAPGEGGGAPLAPGEVHVAALAPGEVVGSPGSWGGGGLVAKTYLAQLLLLPDRPHLHCFLNST